MPTPYFPARSDDDERVFAPLSEGIGLSIEPRDGHKWRNPDGSKHIPSELSDEAPLVPDIVGRRASIDG